MLWEGEPGRGRANSVIGLRPRERWIVQSAKMMATTLQAAIIPSRRCRSRPLLLHPLAHPLAHLWEWQAEKGPFGLL